jgi:hypothetical protein
LLLWEKVREAEKGGRWWWAWAWPAAMNWRKGGDGGVSRRWAVLLCLGSFCLGLLFTNR